MQIGECHLIFSWSGQYIKEEIGWLKWSLAKVKGLNLRYVDSSVKCQRRAYSQIWKSAVILNPLLKSASGRRSQDGDGTSVDSKPTADTTCIDHKMLFTLAQLSTKQIRSEEIGRGVRYLNWVRGLPTMIWPVAWKDYLTLPPSTTRAGCLFCTLPCTKGWVKLACTRSWLAYSLWLKKHNITIAM